MDYKMNIWFEPLHGLEQPVGTTFICYSRKDFQNVEKILQKFGSRGLPYFIDVEGIIGGEMWLHKLEQALDNASCGVIVLTPESIKSPWVWFETGELFGKNTPIIPFIMGVSDKKDEIEKFNKKLPQFIHQFPIIKDIDHLVKVVETHTLNISDIFLDEKLNGKVLSKLKQAKLILVLEDDADRYLLNRQLKFGFKIVRFGRWNFIVNEPHNLDIDETERADKIIYIDKLSYEKNSNALKAEYILPVHKKWGLSFKLFLEGYDMKEINKIISILERNGFKIGEREEGEKNRIFFLIPHEKCRIVDDDETSNNYLYPV